MVVFDSRSYAEKMTGSPQRDPGSLCEYMVVPIPMDVALCVLRGK
jgi:hypothetical protein